MESASAWLQERYPGAPLWASGFSFGARTALLYSARSEVVERALLVALPVAAFACPGLDELKIPALVLQAGDDEYGNQEAVRERFPNLPKGVRTACLRGTDHFFRGRLDALEALIEETAKAWLKESH